MRRRGILSTYVACRDCRFIFKPEAKKGAQIKCPNCGSTNISDDWSGLVIVLDPEKSEIAKLLNITKPGKYALRVR